MAALERSVLDAHELARERACVAGTEQARAGRSDGEGGRHHQVVVRVLEQQHLPDPLRVGELRPRQHEAEAGAEDRGDEPRHASPSSTKAAPIAVAMKTAVATKLARSRAPFRKCRAPTCNRRRCACRARSGRRRRAARPR